LYFRRRAAAAESNAVIFSNNPDATEKLVDKIERLKKRQGLMKLANQLIRKADREGLADLGFSDETIAKLLIEDFAGRVGFPNYASPIIQPTSVDLKNAWPQFRTPSTTKPPKISSLVACASSTTSRPIACKSFWLSAVSCG
jgi:hypothetical protein